MLCDLPDKSYFSILVSLESLYGTCADPLYKAFKQFPRAKSDLFIFEPYFCKFLYYLSTDFSLEPTNLLKFDACLSLPAKSMIVTTF
jgi:hypothetical protein